MILLNYFPTSVHDFSLLLVIGFYVIHAFVVGIHLDSRPLFCYWILPSTYVRIWDWYLSKLQTHIIFLIYLKSLKDVPGQLNAHVQEKFKAFIQLNDLCTIIIIIYFFLSLYVVTLLFLFAFWLFIITFALKCTLLFAWKIGLLASFSTEFVSFSYTIRSSRSKSVNCKQKKKRLSLTKVPWGTRLTSFHGSYVCPRTRVWV